MAGGPEGGRPPPDRVSRPFDRALLAVDTLAAARALIGARLVRAGATPRVGRIVEVEAYIGPADQASHARMGPTDRNRVMFGPPGIAYVYLVYGMHHCLNVVTEPEGRPAAVLIRAIEPVDGTGAMREARESLLHAPVRAPDARLGAGPGLVAAALGIDRGCTGLDLCDPASPLHLEARAPDEPAPAIEATPRIGIGYAGEPWVSVPWRFVAAGSPALSRRPPARPARPTPVPPAARPA
jgi:DNA-3-methyladenine glycosylase